MANNSAILSIRIVGDATSAVREFQRTQDRAQAMQRGLERASQISAAAIAGIAAAAWQVGQVAAEAEQAAGAVDSVFAASADTIKGYAADASQAVGLSAQSYNQLASVLGAQLTNMGLAGSELATQTNDLIGLGADLAATFGGTTADAVAAVSSLLRGERDPIERYGVSIKQADIDARLAAEGLTGLTGEAQRNAQMQATLAILTEQTAAAQGQFAREADTASGAQQRMTAEWENAQAQLGEALLPLMGDLAAVLSDVATWVQENDTLVQGIVITFGVLAGAILAIQAAQIAWNIATSANPIMLVVTTVIALVVWLVTLMGGWEEVGAVVGAVIDGIVAGIQAVIGWIQDAIGWLGELLGLSGEPVDIPTQNNTAVPQLTSGIEFTGGAGYREGDSVTNITVNGAIDKVGTARQIEGIVKGNGQKTGKGRFYEAGGTAWRA